MTPPRILLSIGWAFHRALWRLSGHRIGTASAVGGRLGTLFLVTAGRKSGKQRRTALFYLEDGDRPDRVVVASNGGEDADPQWWRNLQVNPDAWIEIGRFRESVRGRLASAEERARLWPRLVAANPDYATYQAGASREIPVVILAWRSPKPFRIPAADIRPLAEGYGGCIASDRITVDGQRVGFMSRSEPVDELDSGWQFTAGTETQADMDDPARHGIYDVNTIANYDPEIIPLLDSPAGSRFARRPPGGPLRPEPRIGTPADDPG